MPKILISIPPELKSEVDDIVANGTYKNRSEFIREAMRNNCARFHESRLNKATPSADEGDSSIYGGE